MKYSKPQTNYINYHTCHLIIGMVDGWRGSPGGLNNFSQQSEDIEQELFVSQDFSIVSTQLIKSLILE